MVASRSDRNDDWLKAILQRRCGPPLAPAFGPRIVRLGPNREALVARFALLFNEMRQDSRGFDVPRKGPGGGLNQPLASPHMGHGTVATSQAGTEENQG